MRSIYLIFSQLVLLACTINNSYGQKSSDYQIYSTIIEDLFLHHDPGKKIVNNAVVVNQLKIKENWLKEVDEDFDYALTKDPIDSISKKECKKMLLQLKNLYSKNPVLKIDSFTTSMPLHLIKKQKNKNLFLLNTNTGWKRFYKKYPRSIGAFSFTRVMYSGELAVLFALFERSPLATSGDVFVMRRINEQWKIFYKFNLFVS